jgi:hypothetical protein
MLWETIFWTSIIHVNVDSELLSGAVITPKYEAKTCAKEDINLLKNRVSALAKSLGSIETLIELPAALPPASVTRSLLAIILG